MDKDFRVGKMEIHIVTFDWDCWVSSLFFIGQNGPHRLPISKQGIDTINHLAGVEDSRQFINQRLLNY